ncbi:MAG: histidine kinase [Ekhidna sp.]|nr:histidine kinase [Ekhidna sp.]
MKIREIHVRWFGILFIASLATIGDCIGERVDFWFVLKEYFISLTFTLLYWNGSFALIGFFRRRFPEISKTGKRLIYSGLCIVLWIPLGGMPLKLFYSAVGWREPFDFSTHFGYFPFSLTASILVTLSYEAFYFFDKWKEQFRLNEQLKNQQIRTQYEVLQNQMSPHFLFNSLNTLTSIIPENADAAVAFTERLSDVYRYILQNKDRELVTLQEEIAFVKSYMFLLHMRYPDNLTVDFNIEERYYDLTIPPLTIQMLAENAIKHNVVSKSKPLNIDIYIENGKSVVVKNNLQRKESLEKSTKTGLENIRKRYRILGGKEIDIITSASNYMVAVPLINLLEERDLNMA